MSAVGQRRGRERPRVVSAGDRSTYLDPTIIYFNGAADDRCPPFNVTWLALVMPSPTTLVSGENEPITGTEVVPGSVTVLDVPVPVTVVVVVAPRGSVVLTSKIQVVDG